MTLVIIPAYNPQKVLLKVLKSINAQTDYDIIVVNDGSEVDQQGIFDEVVQMNIPVLTHEQNKGKGVAIKTALSYIYNKDIQVDTIVIADADGQHKIADIIKVCDNLINEDSIAIGSRTFTGKIPFRSKFGNIITRYVFRWSSGIKVSDTQTGLRAFNKKLIPFMLDVKGERYEYEMNMLLMSSRKGVAIVEIPIETVYENNNESSHFNTVKDSFRIYKQILKFSCSSFISFLIDFVCYTIIISLLVKLDVQLALIISNVCARLISASSNFYINKKYVFKHKGDTVQSGIQYAMLATFILFVNTGVLSILYKHLIENKLVAKLITEILLFAFSWTIQKKVIFRKRVR